jgi:hypothetical protein
VGWSFFSLNTLAKTTSKLQQEHEYCTFARGRREREGEREREREENRREDIEEEKGRKRTEKKENLTKQTKFHEVHLCSVLTQILRHGLSNCGRFTDFD